MKTPITQPAFMQRAMLSSLLVTLLLLLLFGHHLLSLFTVHLIFWGLVLAILYKTRKPPPTLERNTRTNRRYFTTIFFLQLGYTLFFCAILSLHQFLLPTSPTPNVSLITTVLWHQLYNNALFPWGWVCLVAMAYAQMVYRQKKEADLNAFRLEGHADTNMSSPEDIRLEGKILSVITLGPKYLSILFMGSSIAFSALILLSLINTWHPFFPAGTMPSNVILSLVTLTLFSQPKYQKKLPNFTNAAQHYQFTAAILFLSATVIAALFYDLPQQPIHSPTLEKIQHATSSWMPFLFGDAWWFSASFVLAIKIAFLSKGKKPYEIVIATLIFPLLLLTLIFYLQHHTLPLALTLTQLNTLRLTAIFSAIGAWHYWLAPSRFPMFLTASLPTTSSRKRHHKFFSRQCAQTAALIFGFCLLGAFVFLGYCFFAMGLYLLLLTPYFGWRLYRGLDNS